MKVMLIVPYNSDLIHAVSLPLGLISIGGYLKKTGMRLKSAICLLRIPL